jgi:hypothetical protein
MVAALVDLGHVRADKFAHRHWDNGRTQYRDHLGPCTIYETHHPQPGH